MEIEVFEMVPDMDSGLTFVLYIVLAERHVAFCVRVCFAVISHFYILIYIDGSVSKETAACFCCSDVAASTQIARWEFKASNAAKGLRINYRGTFIKGSRTVTIFYFNF